MRVSVGLPRRLALVVSLIGVCVVARDAARWRRRWQAAFTRSRHPLRYYPARSRASYVARYGRDGSLALSGIRFSRGCSIHTHTSKRLNLCLTSCTRLSTKVSVRDGERASERERERERRDIRAKEKERCGRRVCGRKRECFFAAVPRRIKDGEHRTDLRSRRSFCQSRRIATSGWILRGTEALHDV